MPTQPYINGAGERVPGVTTVINNLGWNRDVLMGWANKIGRIHGKFHKQYVKEAQDVGTLAHAYVEEFLTGELPEDESKFKPEEIKQAKKAFGNWRDWAEENTLEPLLIEEPMVWEEHQIGGCPDIVAILNRRIALTDWKSSKFLSVENVIQGTVYWKMLNALKPELEITRLVIVRMDKQTLRWDHHTFRSLEDLEPCWQAFLHCREIHKLKKQCEAFA